MKFYLNDTLVGSETISAIPFWADPAHPDMGIGAVLQGGNGPAQQLFEGLIKNVEIWQRELSAEEVMEPQNSESLLADYKINQGSGGDYPSTLIDHSGNRNHGLINGATWIESVYGCTDEYACNYNEEANTNDGSCDFGDLCGECGGNNSSCEIIADIDGNEYGSVTIGDQVWMKQNLNVSNNRSCYDDLDSNCELYGGLYEFDDFMTGDNFSDYEDGFCPEGWHVPTLEEFQV